MKRNQDGGVKAVIYYMAEYHKKNIKSLAILIDLKISHCYYVRFHIVIM